MADSGYSSVTSYVIQTNGGSGTTYIDTSPSYGSTVNTATISSLLADTPYSFKIYSINIFGSGPASVPETNFTTFNVPSKLNPPTVTLNTAGTEIHLTWDDPATYEDNGQPIIEVQIRFFNYLNVLTEYPTLCSINSC
jgi:hypothetical protein